MFVADYLSTGNDLLINYRISNKARKPVLTITDEYTALISDSTISLLGNEVNELFTYITSWATDINLYGDLSNYLHRTRNTGSVGGRGTRT